MKPLLLTLTVLGLALCVGPAVAQTRDLSTPAKRLIGHWMDRDSVDYYFDDTDPNTNTGPMWQVDVGGRPSDFRYTITSQVPGGEKVTISIVTFDGVQRSLRDELDIPRDGMTATWTTHQGAVVTVKRLTYLDASTQPQ
jgi:hypothetical protein